MKMYRLLSWVAALLLLACTTDPSEGDPSLGGPPSVSGGHRVPVASALAELEAVLEDIDGPQTRSGGPRSVGTVAAVKASAVLPATRSGEMSGVEDLVYIANFENGEGYAILGADDRLAPVIAVTEQGNLTPEEFAAAARGDYDGSEVPPVVPEAVAYALSIGTGSNVIPVYPPILPPPMEQTYTRYTEWAMSVWEEPLIPIKWNQGDPYNYYCPMITQNGKLVHGYVGCTAVAIGQIFVANVLRGLCFPADYFGGETIDWSLIFEVTGRAMTCVPNDYSNRRILSPGDYSPQALEVAKFLRAIGVAIEMKYYDENKGSMPDSFSTILPFFEDVGMYNPDLCLYSEDKVSRMLDSDLPVFVAADNTHAGGAGHAYVIDGMCQQKRYEETCRRGTGEVVGRKEETRTLFHCNFGYNGKQDGYYYSRVFDLEEGPEVRDPRGDEDSGGANYSNRDYSKNIWIITYRVR